MGSLDGGEREFFDRVSQAAFSNPFGAERDALDQELAAASGEDPALLDRLIGRLRERLDALEGGRHLDAHEGRDRERVEHALLFEAFHRHAADLDALVEAQLEAGAEPVRVTFADDLLRLLTAGGLSSKRAERMLELFWQMRRAFFFIAQGLVGRSPAMRSLRESLWNAVFTRDIRRYDRFLWNRMEDFSTILLGETGTGKGAAAAAVGRSGFIPYRPKKGAFAESFTETFLPLNLSQFPESLLESELFGHRKGAFTGAIEAHAGVFSRCSPHGAIFLDEIGEVGVPVQIKLLRVLQERAFSPVGSHETQRFEGRVIAATHRSLDDLRRSGRLRDDFYYRLSSLTVRVPSLHERLAEDRGELDDLLEVLVPRIVGEAAPGLVAEVRAVLDRDLGPTYRWPGNVRELEQQLRRVLLSGGARPDRGNPSGGAEGRLLDGVRDGAFDAEDLLTRYCAHLYDRHGTYQEVARIVGLDRRTVRRHVERAKRPARGG